MAVKKNTVRKRRPQERAEITKRNLIEVASKAFSERGFDAVTVRDIEVQAGVQRNLVSYHFGSKDELWKAAANYNVQHLIKFAEGRDELLRDISSKYERIGYVIRTFVRFSAKHPGLNLLLIEEGTQKSWRMEWLVENHVRPLMKTIRELVQADLELTEQEFISWYYTLIGGGAMIFALSYEAKLLFDVNTSKSEMVDLHADMLTQMLLSKIPNSGNDAN